MSFRSLVRSGKRRMWKAALAGALLLGANLGWATNTNCTGSYNLAADSTGLVTGGSYSGGCEIADVNFTSFSLTQGTGPAGTNLSVQFFGAVLMNGGDSEPQVAGNWTTGMTTIVDETATIDNADPSSLPPAGTYYAITSLELGVVTPGTNGSGNLDMLEEFCLGSATFNCTSTSANYGYIHLIFNQMGTGGEYTCLNAGASSCVPTTASSNHLFFTDYLPQGTQVVAMQTTITTTGFLANLADFDNFVDYSAETPEPSTFGLMGFALCAFWLLFNYRRSE